MKVKATREQLIEWIRYSRGELSLQEVSDDVIVLMSRGVKPGDIIVMPGGEHVVPMR